ncbi:LuxR C-terminal-related transcriptional regulator, partial [Tepidicella baoligensis]|uniref:LuxR C-terminal-related transcriptional regulator n=1 Tax=Tepidicella baoligensis TaxID=2707016 RepID=UPI0015DA4D15
MLLDLNLPVPAGEPPSAELPGLKVLPRLRKLTQARIVVLSMYDESAVVLRALQLGASGFVTKSSPGDRLFEAIDAVRHGTTYVDPAILGVTAAPALSSASTGTVDPFREKTGDELSRQEREVGQLLLAGLTQKAISHRLGVSPQTTHTYKRRLKEKLGAPRVRHEA